MHIVLNVRYKVTALCTSTVHSAASTIKPNYSARIHSRVIPAFSCSQQLFYDPQYISYGLSRTRKTKRKPSGKAVDYNRFITVTDRLRVLRSLAPTDYRASYPAQHERSISCITTRVQSVVSVQRFLY